LNESRFLNVIELRSIYRYSIGILSLSGHRMIVILNLDAECVSVAKEITGISDTTALAHEAMKALIEREAARRLAATGGGSPNLRRIPRRRPPEFNSR